MTGCLLAVLTYFPLFKALTAAANPALAAAQAAAPVVVSAVESSCSVQFNAVGTSRFTSACDVAKAALVKRGVPYKNADVGASVVSAPAALGASIRVGVMEIASYDGTTAGGLSEKARFEAELDLALSTAGYPRTADLAALSRPKVIGILFILMLYVTMVYGPVAAMLVELFPTRIRYTSMSLPYHIGNGWFGGFLPTTSFAIVAATGDIYSGLWYPIIIAAMTLVVGMIFLRETKDVDIENA